MLDLLIAAALTQGANAAPDPCHALVRPDPLPAACPRWRPLARNGANLVALDAASVVRTGESFTIHVRLTYSTGPRDGVGSAVQRTRIDCRARTEAGEYIILYDPEGRSLGGAAPTGEDAAATPIRPGEPIETVLTEFCPR